MIVIDALNADLDPLNHRCITTANHLHLLLINQVNTDHARIAKSKMVAFAIKKPNSLGQSFLIDYPIKMAEDIDLGHLIVINHLTKTAGHLVDLLSKMIENTDRDHFVDLLNETIECTGPDHLIDPVSEMIEDIDQDRLVDLISEMVVNVDLDRCDDRSIETVNDTDLGPLVENTHQIVIEEDHDLRIAEGTLA